MTKDELKAGIIEAGGQYNARASKAELEEVYNQLVGENSSEEDLNLEQTKVGTYHDMSLQDESDGSGASSTDEPKSEFDELQEKIEGAEIPKEKISEGKPLFEQTKRKIKKGGSSPDSFRIEGYVLLLVTDTIFPFTLAFLNNLLDKKTKVKATDLQLNETDFKKLEPLADQAADYMSVNLNPIAGFLLVSTFMYSNNLLATRMQIEKT